MACSEFMFLFEIAVEKVLCYERFKKFYLRSDFSDVFSIYLSKPKGAKSNVYYKKKCKKLRKNGNSINKNTEHSNLQSHEKILFRSDVESLQQKMYSSPMELIILIKHGNKVEIGSTEIVWNNIYYDFLNKINKNPVPDTLTQKGEYFLYNNKTSKRMALVDLKINLSLLENNCTGIHQPEIEFKENQIYSPYNMQHTKTFLNLNSLYKKEILNAGTIKTKYRGKELRQYSRVKNIHIKDDNKCLSNKNSINQLTDSIHNQVYCVGYCTVQNDMESKVSPSSSASKVSKKKGDSSSSQTSEKDSEPPRRYKIKVCDSECPNKPEEDVCSVCSLDLPETAAPLITVTKCKDVTCDGKEYRRLPTPVDSKILIGLHSVPCCDPNAEVTKLQTDVIFSGSVKTAMQIGEKPCVCTCDCHFGLTKRTTYCTVCKGYQVCGDDLSRRPGFAMPHPCPLYHKLMDKPRKTLASTSGSDSKRGPKRVHRPDALALEVRTSAEKRSLEAKKEEKAAKRKRDERFKFRYGFEGIPPKIGHSKCHLPCQGTIGSVPKHMGWLWTAEDVPGLKFRPNWKPGASNKYVVRMLKMAKNPEEVSKKKRKKDPNKRKNKRPLLVVHKKDGEYNVTMETMKVYQKPRNLNQHPYEDKPVLTYTIGRTDAENIQRQKKKDRRKRRLERAQREFIESSFKNMCEDVCLKTYRQALAILPDAEDPDCPCYPALPDPEKLGLERSCSCSEDDNSSGSETDSDEWIVEFTPPNAKFDPTYKGKRIVKVENGSQYTYLDYRVKLLDRFGNPVPRFFTGPNGNQECSDLGGFWSSDKKWLEINIDGYVAPDGRWAPNSFIGPGGEQVDAEGGKFQTANGKWLVVGIDGFVDCQGKWRFYKRRGALTKTLPQKTPTGKRQGGGDKKNKKQPQEEDKKGIKKSQSTWSCFGENISPKHLSEMGIMGHGRDKEMLKKYIKDLVSKGHKIAMPKKYGVPRSKRKRALHSSTYDTRSYYTDRETCRHAAPSDKGIVAVDPDGNKAYFKLRHYNNPRPSDRKHALNDRGISVSSFHVPCLSSFISTEFMKQQQRARLFELAARLASNHS